MKKMRKILTCMLLIGTLSIGISNKASAAILSFGSGGLATFSQVYLGISAVSAATVCTKSKMETGKFCSELNSHPQSPDIDGWISIIGIIILEGNQSLKVNAISPEQATQVGLENINEIQIFNDNLDELNQVLTASSKIVADLENPTSETVNTIILEQGKSMNPIALNVFMKVRAYNSNTLTKGQTTK